MTWAFYQRKKCQVPNHCQAIFTAAMNFLYYSSRLTQWQGVWILTHISIDFTELHEGRKILEFSSVKSLRFMVCNKRFFQLSEDWSLSVFEASVTRVSQSIGTIRVFWGSAEASQFWQKEESFFLFFFCCFCALLQTNSCEKRPLWTSIKRSRKLIFGLPKKCVFHVQN